MPDEIVVATTTDDYAAFGDLIREYWQWLQARYGDLPGFIDAVGGHQALDAELDSLSDKFGPPNGKTLLARRGGVIVGCIAYRDLGDGACEMKRLYVPDQFQGAGTGRRLCEALLDDATAQGYDVMRLDTGHHNQEALKMYKALGFRERPPYHQYPATLMPHLIFMERPLSAA